MNKCVFFLCCLVTKIALSSPLHTDRLYIFISFSMPNSLIDQYIQSAMTVKDVSIVFVLRGVSSSMTLHEFILRKLWPLLGHRNEFLPVIIDPRLFERFHVKLVPTFVNEHHKFYCEVSGAVSINWVLNRCQLLIH